MRLILIMLMFVWGGIATAGVSEPLAEATLVQTHKDGDSKNGLEEKLERVQSQTIVTGADSQAQAPAVFLLNSAEVQLFLRKNYRAQKELVDLASRLTAFGYVELKVRQDYLDSHALSAQDLPSFIIVVKNSAA